MTEETRQLLLKAHQGDREARDRLVAENVGLIWGIVKHYKGCGQEMEDLFQIGSMGLIRAIDRFDFTFKAEFSTYAVPVIAGEIKRFIRDDGLIKVSRGMKEKNLHIRKAREELAMKLGREPGLEEIADRLGDSVEEIAACMEAEQEITSFDAVTASGDSQGMNPAEKIPARTITEEEILNQIMVGQLLDSLNPTEREIIWRRYFKEETQSRIAADLEISQVSVSRMEKRILKQMRSILEEKKTENKMKFTGDTTG